MTQTQMYSLSDPMQHCLTNCQNCHAICTQTLSYCLEQGGAHAAPEHIRVLQDCAQICATSADFILRGSPFHPHTCQACAALCDACAKSCSQVSSGDDQMRACIEICRRCADSCHELAA